VAATNNPGVNVIKLFTFITDNEDQSTRGFALGNNFQSGLSIWGQGQSKPNWKTFQILPSWVSLLES